ncbi:MAG TPA: 30S ribosomal protein S21 [Candidatus Paceibacterota bacterium]|nr:30S ribosomal protein S21 [Candidatus Paceibacterota bacterium]
MSGKKMVIEVEKQGRENSQSLIRRFTKKVQKSGVLLRARRGRFFRRPKSETMKKRAALRREKLTKEYEKLRKFGLEKK